MSDMKILKTSKISKTSKTKVKAKVKIDQGGETARGTTEQINKTEAVRTLNLNAEIGTIPMEQIGHQPASRVRSRLTIKS